MKILIYSFIVIAVGLMIYNFTFVDFDNALEGDSATAVIGILASSIVVVLMIILLMSRSISKKVRE
jgi:hypothetical protein